MWLLGLPHSTAAQGAGGTQEGASERKETEVSLQPRRASAEKPQDTTSATNDAFLHGLIKVVIGPAQSWGGGEINSTSIGRGLRSGRK